MILQAPLREPCNPSSIMLFKKLSFTGNLNGSFLLYDQQVNLQRFCVQIVFFLKY